MNQRILTRRGLVLGGLFVGLLVTGCATPISAPVADRGGVASGGIPAATAPRPGFHVVRPGDTLYSIAQRQGVTVRDLVAWNQIADPNQLEVGTELRVAPLDAVVVSPINIDGPAVEVKPVAPETAPDLPALKQDPKGGKQPYTDQAWAAAQSGAAPGVAAVDPKAAEPAKPSTALPPGARTVDGVEWSWPVGGSVFSGFKDNPRKGLDISGKPGDSVFAAAGGKVVYSGTGLRGYGKLVIIKHDSNYLSAYAHNRQLLVKEGETVEKGQKIAELGSTDSDRPKLHFEIRRQGKPVDPANYLPQR